MLKGYQGAITLKPEKLDTWQLSVEHSMFDDNSLSNRINFFSNDFTDVVYRNAGVYGNAGTVKSNGIEYEIGYRQPSIATRANYTYQNTTEATGYAVKEWQLENVPQHMANLLVDYALFLNCVYYVVKFILGDRGRFLNREKFRNRVAYEREKSHKRCEYLHQHTQRTCKRMGNSVATVVCKSFWYHLAEEKHNHCGYNSA
jgi:hypothetical protein